MNITTASDAGLALLQQATPGLLELHLDNSSLPQCEIVFDRASSLPNRRPS